MSIPFLGEIKMFGGNYAPNNFAMCTGQLLPITQNGALFKLIGTAFGGDGQSTFGLPNFSGRSPVGSGTLQGNSTPFTVGATGGQENVTLSTGNMPAHTHAPMITMEPATTDSPEGNLLAVANDGSGNSIFIYGTSVAGNLVPLAPNALSSTGGSAPFNVRNPYQAVTFIIATNGVVPPPA